MLDWPPIAAVASLQVNAVATEAELMDAFVDAVRALDPDILVGYDVRKVSPCASGECAACRRACAASD